jgi:phosphoglycolate phosphatase
MTTLDAVVPILTKNFDLIVFDWDGTIMDSTGLIAECVQFAARDMGWPVPDIQTAKSIIGLGLEDAVGRLFPDKSPSQYQEFAKKFRYYYITRDHEAPLYLGISSLIAGIYAGNCLTAVATGKPRRGLDRAFEYTGLNQYFHFSRCADEGFSKPNPEMLFKLMDVAGVEPKRTLMIGDTTFDLQLAHNAGCKSIAVTYGAHDAPTLQTVPAEAYLSDVPSLSGWISQYG